MFTDYKPTVGFDEYFCGETATPRADLAPLLASLGQMGLPELNRSHASASQLLRRLGATFRLNDSGLKGSERILPFDPLPRLIGRSDWMTLESGDCCNAWKPSTASSLTSMAPSRSSTTV